MADVGRVLGGRYHARGAGRPGWHGHHLPRVATTKLGRDVAIKVLRGEYGSDASFLAAVPARGAGRRAAEPPQRGRRVRLRHRTRSGPYIVMELVTGGDLAGALRERGPLPPTVAASIAQQIADALDAAHARGIVHRDIKPSNVLLSTGGRVKVADFGIAQAFTDAQLTMTGVTMGSVHYFSPEQARGEPVDARPRTSTPPGSCCTRCSPGSGRSAAAPRRRWRWPACAGRIPSPVRGAAGRARGARRASCAGASSPTCARGRPRPSWRPPWVGSWPTRSARPRTTPCVRPPARPRRRWRATTTSTRSPRARRHGSAGLGGGPHGPVRAGRRRGAALLSFVSGSGVRGRASATPASHAPGPTARARAAVRGHAHRGCPRHRRPSVAAARREPADERRGRPGTVIDQDPAEGAMVPPGGAVKVVVAQEVDTVRVPDLRGDTETRAKTRLVEAGLKPTGRFQTYDRSVRRGRVVRTEPAAGTEVAEGTTVAYYVSRGARPTDASSPESAAARVGDYRCLSLDEASRQVADAGLVARHRVASRARERRHMAGHRPGATGRCRGRPRGPRSGCGRSIPRSPARPEAGVPPGRSVHPVGSMARRRRSRRACAASSLRCAGAATLSARGDVALSPLRYAPDRRRTVLGVFPPPPRMRHLPQLRQGRRGSPGLLRARPHPRGAAGRRDPGVLAGAIPTRAVRGPVPGPRPRRTRRGPGERAGRGCRYPASSVRGRPGP